MALDEWPRVAGIALAMQHAAGARVGLGIGADLLERRQPHDGLRVAQHAPALVGVGDVVSR